MAVANWIITSAQTVANEARRKGGDWKAVEKAVLRYLASRGVSSSDASSIAHKAAVASRSISTQAAPQAGATSTASRVQRGSTGPGAGQQTTGAGAGSTSGGGTGITTGITGTGGAGNGQTITQNPGNTGSSTQTGGSTTTTGGTGTGTGTGGTTTTTPPPVTDPLAAFRAWYLNDPRYALNAPQWASQENALEAQYGWNPVYETDAHGNPLMDQFGQPTIKTWQQQGKDQNPYSVANLLAKQFGQNSEDWQNQANARGILFSGSQVARQAGEADAYQQNLQKQLEALQSAFGQVAQNRASLLGSLWPDYLKTLPAGGVGTAPPTAIPPVTTTPPATVTIPGVGAVTPDPGAVAHANQMPGVSTGANGLPVQRPTPPPRPPAQILSQQTINRRTVSRIRLNPPKLV